MPEGTYERYYELGDAAKDKAKAFLSEAVMGDEIPFSPGKEADAIRLVLSVDSDGVLKRSIDPESYKAAQDALSEELLHSFRSLIALRMETAGLGEVSDDEIDALFEKEFGIGIAGYLEEYGPEMLPALEELSGRFDATSRCRAEKSDLVFPDGTRIGYLLNDDLLVLQYASGETEVYTKVKESRGEESDGT